LILIGLGSMERCLRWHSTFFEVGAIW